MSCPASRFSLKLPVFPASAVFPPPGTVVWLRWTCGFEVLGGADKTQNTNGNSCVMNMVFCEMDMLVKGKSAPLRYTRVLLLPGGRSTSVGALTHWLEFQKRKIGGRALMIFPLKPHLGKLTL